MEATPAADDLHLLNRLLEADPSPCPVCRRPLQNPLDSPRCTRCSERLSIRLALVEPMTGWIITGAIGLGAAFGFCAGIALYLISQLFIGFGGGPPNARVLLIATGTGTALAGLLVLLWSSRRGRNWIRHRSLIVRLVLVGVCWLAPPLTLFIFVMLLR